MVQEADAGSAFGAWEVKEGTLAIGCNPLQEGFCAVFSPPIKIKASFVPAAPLTLIKGGYAQGGTVTSKPGGIDCDTACEEETAEFPEGEPVTLTAKAAAGYVFAGWLGCKHISASPKEGKCEVTVKAR